MTELHDFLRCCSRQLFVDHIDVELYRLTWPTRSRLSSGHRRIATPQQSAFHRGFWHFPKRNMAANVAVAIDEKSLCHSDYCGVAVRQLEVACSRPRSAGAHRTCLAFGACRACA